jgi:NAD-dependent dihydropyrimidine dehydrogenase PreA subunit
MSVLINFKICDNSCECGGIKICPNGALFWDTKNNKIGIDNEKCISCGICVKECPIGAIKVANNKK